MPSKDINQNQNNENDLIARPLETDTLDNETEGQAPMPQTKAKPKRQKTVGNVVPREQILKRYQTVSIPKTTETTRSGRKIKPVERLNLSATQSD